MHVQRLSHVAYNVAKENSIDCLQAGNNDKCDAERAGWMEWKTEGRSRSKQASRHGQAGRQAGKLAGRQTDRQAIDNKTRNKNTQSNSDYRSDTVPVRSCHWLPNDLIGAGVRQRGSMVGWHLVMSTESSDLTASFNVVRYRVYSLI